MNQTPVPREIGRNFSHYTTADTIDWNEFISSIESNCLKGFYFITKKKQIMTCLNSNRHWIDPFYHLLKLHPILQHILLLLSVQLIFHFVLIVEEDFDIVHD